MKAHKTTVIAAIGTPLDEHEYLHASGLEIQLARLEAAGISGIFAAGTLGMMPLLTDATYVDLIAKTVAYYHGKGELLVGVSDLSYARTLERINLVNTYKNDGVVVLPPYFMRFSQPELIDYFTALADAARTPLYLYDLPQRTYAPLDPSTVLTLAKHPNIAGIKCSGDLDQSRKLIEALESHHPGFRVIVAKPDEMHALIREGVNEHLDGIHALAPQWSMRIARCAERQSTDGEQAQRNLTELLNALRRYGSLPALTVLMNACGVPGCFAPKPFAALTAAQAEALLEETVVKGLLKSASEST